MGLCASKSEKKVNHQATIRTKPQRVGQNSTQKKLKVPIKQTNSSDAKKSSGRPLSEGHTAENVSPQEAARRAAEQRLENNVKDSTKGELGRKLAQERAKSHSKHMRETAEQRQHEKNRPPVYD